MARYALRYPDRRRGLGACVIGVVMSLAGCASSLAPDDPYGSQLLKPWQTITGARLQSATTIPAFGNLTKAGVTSYLAFLSPTHVAVRNNLVYVVDAGYQQIFRYDATQMAMSRFADYPAVSIADIAVGPDMSLYVVDPRSRKVLHFSHDGRLLRQIGSEQALARPAAMVLDEPTGQVLVGDSLYNHVVVFSSLGLPLGTLKSLHTRSIDAMARGPDGLYLVDRVSKQVVVIGMDGLDRYTFGEGILKDPLAIAVDRNNRVFVSDGFDNTIKVFEAGEHVADFGGTVGTPVHFNRITSLAMDRTGLYAADSLNTRILIFHVSPPAVPETAKKP